jgi:predicted ATPase
MILSQVNIDDLYPKGPMKDVFQRTLSRMKEMQSDWYWQS